MTASPKPDVTVVGAGPTGALAALLLARRGYRVNVFEFRDDIGVRIVFKCCFGT